MKHTDIKEIYRDTYKQQVIIGTKNISELGLMLNQLKAKFNQGNKMKYENNKIVYEIGDWVTMVRGGEGCNCRVGETREIESADQNNCSLGGGAAPFTSYINLRPATQEEIDKATQEEKIMVNENEVRFFSDRIEIGCVTVSEKLFLKIGKKAGWFDK